MSINISGSNLTTGINYTVIPSSSGSISFNGINQSIVYNYVDGFNLATGNPDFSIELWFYINSLPGTGAAAYELINNGGISSYSYSQYQIFVGVDGLLYASLGTAGGASAGYSDTYIGTTTSQVTINTWHHVALVRNGNYAAVYLDGVVFGSKSLGTTFYPDSFRSANSPTFIGGVSGDYSYSSYASPYGYISNVRIIKGTSAYNPNFTPPTTPLTAVTGTSILLDVASSGTYLTDSSTNNYTVTNTNGVSYSSSTPISSGGSLSFNGTNQTLAVVGTLGGPLDLSTGAPNWTIESWVYFNSVSGRQIVIVNGGYSGISNPSYAFYIESGGTSSFWVVGNGGGGGNSLSGGTFSINTWYHIAFVRNGNTLTTYLNGNVVASSPLTVTMVNVYSYNLGIGSGVIQNSANYFNGYLTNLRIVKGYALYTSNFVPPNSPFATSQTSNSNGSPSNLINTPQTTFLLNTPNNSLFLQNGSVYTITGAQATTAALTAKPLIPAVTSTSLSPFPGSVKFNGTSQSLTAPSNNVFGYVSGTDFTIEMWIYVIAINGSANMSLLDSRPASTQGVYTTLYINTTGNIVYNTNSADRITSGSTVSINTWYHVALVRLSGSTKLYLNGTQTGSSYTDTNSYITSAQQIGASYNNGAALTNFYNGYISSLRIVKGVGVYSSTFTTPTNVFLSTQDPNLFGNPSAAITGLTGSQTSLLLRTTNDTNFLADNSGNSLTITNNGTAVTSALNPFNGNYGIINNPGSVQLNGTSQYLSIPSNAALNFGTGDFTVEAWVNTTAANAGDFFIISSTGTGGFFFGYNSSAAQYGWGITGLTWDGYSGFTKTNSVWQHIAISRQGTSMRMFLNGVQSVGAQTNSAAYDLSLTSTVVGWQQLTYYFPGYISNLRVVKGVAVYTSNFTPPVAPLNNYQAANQSGAPSAAITSSQTSLLLNTAYGNDFLLDTSINKFTVTNVGTATSAILDPF